MWQKPGHLKRQRNSMGEEYRRDDADVLGATLQHSLIYRGTENAINIPQKH